MLSVDKLAEDRKGRGACGVVDLIIIRSCWVKVKFPIQSKCVYIYNSLIFAFQRLDEPQSRTRRVWANDQQRRTCIRSPTKGKFSTWGRQLISQSVSQSANPPNPVQEMHRLLGLLYYWIIAISVGMQYLYLILCNNGRNGAEHFFLALMMDGWTFLLRFSLLPLSVNQQFCFLLLVVGGLSSHSWKL